MTLFLFGARTTHARRFFLSMDRINKIYYEFLVKITFLTFPLFYIIILLKKKKGATKKNDYYS